jgi:hypothetical protein
MLPSGDLVIERVQQQKLLAAPADAES